MFTVGCSRPKNPISILYFFVEKSILYAEITLYQKVCLKH